MASLKLHEPAANTAAIITYTRGAETPQMIHWSYDGAPTGGGITIVVGGVTKYAISITAGGPGFLPMQNFPIEGSGVVTITLLAGGGGVTGKINGFFS